jgi:aromatic ring hydroxylase
MRRNSNSIHGNIGDVGEYQDILHSSDGAAATSGQPWYNTVLPDETANQTATNASKVR